MKKHLFCLLIGPFLLGSAANGMNDFDFSDDYWIFDSDFNAVEPTSPTPGLPETPMNVTQFNVPTAVPTSLNPGQPETSMSWMNDPAIGSIQTESTSEPNIQPSTSGQSGYQCLKDVPREQRGLALSSSLNFLGLSIDDQISRGQSRIITQTMYEILNLPGGPTPKECNNIRMQIRYIKQTSPSNRPNAVPTSQNTGQPETSVSWMNDSAIGSIQTERASYQSFRDIPRKKRDEVLQQALSRLGISMGDQISREQSRIITQTMYEILHLPGVPTPEECNNIRMQIRYIKKTSPFNRPNAVPTSQNTGQPETSVSWMNDFAPIDLNPRQPEIPVRGMNDFDPIDLNPRQPEIPVRGMNDFAPIVPNLGQRGTPVNGINNSGAIQTEMTGNRRFRDVPFQDRLAALREAVKSFDLSMGDRVTRGQSRDVMQKIYEILNLPGVPTPEECNNIRRQIRYIRIRQTSPWTKDEDNLLLDLYQRLGRNWKKYLPYFSNKDISKYYIKSRVERLMRNDSQWESLALKGQSE